MKKKDEITYMQKEKYKLSFWWMPILLIVVLGLSFFYVNYVKGLVYKNIYSNIKELSQQTATQLNLGITDQKNFVNIMVDSINRGYLKSPEEIFESYKGDLEDYHFTRLVILDKKGNGTTSDGHAVKDYANIEEFFNNQEEVYLSENRPSTVSNNQVNIYSKTFELNGEELVLMATINTEDYKDILLRRLFGKGGTYLINNDGLVLIDSFNNIKEENVIWYDYVKKNYRIEDEDILQKIDDMAKSIKRKEVGTFDVDLGKETYFIHYEKVNINDWYVITTASDTTIGKELITLVVMSFVLCLLISFGMIVISIYINVSNQKKNRKLYKVAYIDPITLLGNEAYFKDNGQRYLQETKKNRYIIALDINKFKALNNIYGYEFCNEILKEAGRKLSSILPEGNITCRMGNDIFAAIFSYSGDINKLLNKIFYESSKLEVQKMKLHINLSIGVYKVQDNENDINKVLDKAYMARTKIKGLYHDNYYIFDEVLENKIVEEQQIESSMEDALINEEFKIVYQPKVSTKDEKVVGAEALVRWEKDGEMIPPNKFIPLFEANKFIIKLDLYIFEHVCKDIAKWKELYNYVPTISINVSKEHFANENFIEEYTKIANKYGLEASSIDLEITESATIDKSIDILNVLNRIKKEGFMISIDDFGTGYSSLSMLQNMPIDIIKIDKVFVDKADLASDQNMINYIMLIAKHLGVKTIVEGVETKKQMEFVTHIGCDIIQGYYYSKPITKEDFEEYFNQNK